MRKSVSTGAIDSLASIPVQAIEDVGVSVALHAPISTVAACVFEHYDTLREFPNDALDPEKEKGLVSCIMTPSEAPEETSSLYKGRRSFVEDPSAIERLNALRLRRRRAKNHRQEDRRP